MGGTADLVRRSGFPGAIGRVGIWNFRRKVNYPVRATLLQLVVLTGHLPGRMCLEDLIALGKGHPGLLAPRPDVPGRPPPGGIIERAPSGITTSVIGALKRGLAPSAKELAAAYRQADF
jgi:hypothetical protein